MLTRIRSALGPWWAQLRRATQRARYRPEKHYMRGGNRAGGWVTT
jgi:hypothetical protein